jgi:hypothetical protein
MLDEPELPQVSEPRGRIAVRTALRLALALAGGVILSGCAVGPGGQIMSQQEIEESVPLQPVPVSNAWISAPDTQLVLQRELGFGSEQRISLRNRTLVPGDNLIVLRTRSGMQSRGRLRFEEFKQRVGEIPHPFADVTSGELVSGEDELGSYLWTEERFGADTICVLGVRRVDSSMRQIPGGGAVMDVMMRNCVAGTAEDALQPLLAGSVAVPAVAQSGSDQDRLISPLAGPTMR